MPAPKTLVRLLVTLPIIALVMSASVTDAAAATPTASKLPASSTRETTSTTTVSIQTGGLESASSFAGYATQGTFSGYVSVTSTHVIAFGSMPAPNAGVLYLAVNLTRASVDTSAISGWVTFWDPTNHLLAYSNFWDFVQGNWSPSGISYFGRIQGLAANWRPALDGLNFSLSTSS